MQQVAHPVSAISIRVYDAITYSLTVLATETTSRCNEDDDGGAYRSFSIFIIVNLRQLYVRTVTYNT